jgi:hypothetical protein
MVVADGILTNMLINRGIASEANPFLVHLAGEHGLIIVKVLGVALCVIILRDVSRHHSRTAFWASSAFLFIYTCIVAWNLRLLLIGMA